ncbi:hypothetical protein BDEG_25317 [Batrachochytrium dendrobatidis JEL423]|uniref:Aldehyde dehydrogenase n=1 Tax=Batrachochytrium dendrobatidis (strain JEL423) TaxID=403673 RepID=A0A177WNW3_BATDL|nr:hypothetical protein BDEG_25317 [Batrachochytrium dendrobatidis JEL423]
MEHFTPVQDIDGLVDDARISYAQGRTRSASWREQQLRALYRFTIKEEDALTAAVHMDLRKSPAETVIFEIGFVRNAIIYALEHLHDWMNPTKVCGGSLAFALDRCEIRNDPLGVVLIIGTWNYPIYLSLSPLVSAISAGNAVVMKFSELAPHTSLALYSLLPKYMDPTSIKYVYGDIPQSSKLLEMPFGLIFYTGNATVARVVMQAAAKHLTPVVLELGGKSPTCVAPDHVYVHKSIAQDFYAYVPTAIKELLGDNPAASDVYPRLINRRHFERLEKVLGDQLKVAGTEIVHGGQMNSNDLFISPTVLRGVSADATIHPIMDGEIFGPILPIIEYSDIEDVFAAIREIGKTPLALYPFSSNQKFIDRVIKNVPSGNVVANDLILSLAVDSLPFGGMGESGMGAYHGKFGFDAFTKSRAVMIRPNSLEILNKIRYQQVSFNRKKAPYHIVCWLLFRHMPSRFMLNVRRLSMWTKRAVGGLGLPLAVVLGIMIGGGLIRLVDNSKKLYISTTQFAMLNRHSNSTKQAAVAVL